MKGIRVGYPFDHQPLMEAPAQGCHGCPARAVCVRLQPTEEVLCELPDAVVGIEAKHAERTDNWLNATHAELRTEDPWFDFPNRAQ